jgi:hypothetical protein
VRYWAARTIRASVLRKETAERQGRQPRAIDKRLSKLANATVPDIFGGRL